MGRKFRQERELSPGQYPVCHAELNGTFEDALISVCLLLLSFNYARACPASSTVNAGTSGWLGRQVGVTLRVPHGENALSLPTQPPSPQALPRCLQWGSVLPSPFVPARSDAL